MALTGLAVPTPTLFDAEEELDPEKNREYARALARAEVDHLFVLGSLGEFPSVEEAERRALVRAVADGLGGRTDLWVGVGAPSTRLAIRRAREAEELGAAVLVAVPPFYLRPTTDAVAEYYRRIRRAVDRPLLAYNIPEKVGYALTPELVHSLAGEGVLAGVKDTAGHLESVAGFLDRAPPGFVVLPGDDSLVLAAVRAGASGAVMGTANIVPRLARELLNVARAGTPEEASRLQGLVDQLVYAQSRGPFPSSTKFLARSLRGAPDGYRAPYGPLTDAERGAVYRSVEPIRPLIDRYLRET